MGRNIKKLEFKILLFVLTFLFSLACFAGNKQIIAGPSSGIDFMTNGENLRMSIDASGNIVSTGDIDTTGDILLTGNYSSSGSIEASTGDFANIRLIDEALTNKVTIKAGATTDNYDLILPSSNCAEGEAWTWDASGKPQCEVGGGGISFTGNDDEIAVGSGGNLIGNSKLKFNGATVDIDADLRVTGKIFATNDAFLEATIGNASNCYYDIIGNVGSWEIPSDSDCTSSFATSDEDENSTATVAPSDTLGFTKNIPAGQYFFKMTWVQWLIPAATGYIAQWRHRVAVCSGSASCSTSTADYYIGENEEYDQAAINSGGDYKKPYSISGIVNIKTGGVYTFQYHDYTVTATNLTVLRLYGYANYYIRFSLFKL